MKEEMPEAPEQKKELPKKSPKKKRRSVKKMGFNGRKKMPGGGNRKTD